LLSLSGAPLSDATSELAGALELSPPGIAVMRGVLPTAAAPASLVCLPGRSRFWPTVVRAAPGGAGGLRQGRWGTW
jgi:hypothetical protein